ncbi:MAG: DNA mismatch repair protein MutS, partial [Lachnospiraceae bacterium]|nr:DNA mismatch repair protein MutS [Lachnospiraceae bacterium]
ALRDEIVKFAPSEVVGNEALLISGLNFREPPFAGTLAFNPLPPRYYKESETVRRLTSHFSVAHTDALGLRDLPLAAQAAAALLAYLEETQKNSLKHINRIQIYNPGQYMLLDSTARRNLELTETLRDQKRKGSLLWVLDKTSTAMGARRLRSFLEQPLVDKKEILARQDAIEELNGAIIDREELREYLGPIYDLERLIGRLAFGSATPRDMIALKQSLSMIPHIKTLLALKQGAFLCRLQQEMDSLEDMQALLEAAIAEDPPLGLKEGGIIKAGYSEENDRLHAASTEGKTWLLDLESRERERTGIKNLKIKFNKVFGYYFEVTNSYKDLVPADYIRKQTLVGAERYTTPGLKELEDLILGAQDKSRALEYELFCQVRETLVGEIPRLKKTAQAVALLDALVSLAVAADRYGYVRPSINEKGIIRIKEGRHPVVEQMLEGERFIANDTDLDGEGKRLAIITGPNMAGKSTYMRQTALIVLMAQIGSFVPASEADICLCDRIFTRVGASDDLSSGQSTFMVEMTEVSHILRHATRKSLVILDEIGRGTSTFDGLSIAWAVAEYVASTKLLGAKTLFATHYHELTELEGSVAGVKNYCVAVKEQGDSVIFLRKIIPGGADRSYGIQVARLAGLPESVLRRAAELVEELSDADISRRAAEIVAGDPGRRRPSETAPLIRRPDEVDRGQLSLFGPASQEEILEEIKALDLEEMTPKEALNTLYRIQSEIHNRSSEA